jgi:hypothetical protein
MWRELDYATYDPENFVRDHPDEPVVLECRDRAAALSENLQRARLEGTPLDRRREIEQGFDRIQEDHWERTDVLNRAELYKELQGYRDDQLDATYVRGREGVNRTRNANGQVAAWQGTPQGLEQARSITIEEARAQSPEFDRQVEQLTHYQAARNEAASNEIERARDQVLKHRGLDQVDLAEPVRDEQDQGPNTVIPEKLVAAADVERVARIREALNRPTSSKDGGSRDHAPDMD